MEYKDQQSDHHTGGDRPTVPVPVLTLVAAVCLFAGAQSADRILVVWQSDADHVGLLDHHVRHHAGV